MIDLNNFGFATVMDICVFKLKDVGYDGVLTRQDFEHQPKIFLNTLKITNLKEKGPTTTIKSGKMGIPVKKYGRTITMDINDALGKVNTLIEFFGLKQSGNRLYRDVNFTDALCLEGKVKVVDTEAHVTDLYLFIPCFMPNGTLNINMDSEKTFGVFDLSGELFPVFIQESDSVDPHLEFYSFSQHSFFDEKGYSEYVENNDTIVIAPSFDEPTVDENTAIFSGDTVILENQINQSLD